MSQGLTRYVSLLTKFFSMSLMADMQYRVNMVGKIGTDLIWYMAQLSVFEVLFYHSESISGWNIHSTRVFMGILFTVDALWMILFSENLDRLSTLVRKGELDLLLVKPIRSQFLVSLRKMNTAYAGNLFLTLIYLTWALAQYPDSWSAWRLFILAISIPSSLIIVYSFRLMFSMLAIIYQNADAINYVWYQIYRLGTRPDPIYPVWIRYVILTILPVGFVASVPARLLLHEWSTPLALSAPLLACFLLWLSAVLWNRALQHYTSASS